MGFDISHVAKLRRNSDEFKDFCYMACEKYQNDEAMLFHIAEMLNLTVYELKAYARLNKELDKYYDYNIEYNSNIKKKRYITSGNSSVHGDFIEKLLKEENTDKIIELFEEQKDIIDNFRYSFEAYIYNMYPNKIDMLMDNLDRKFKLYQEYVHNKKQEKVDRSKDEHKAGRKIEALNLLKEILENDNEITAITQIPHKYHITGIYQSIYDIWVEEKVLGLIYAKIKNNRMNRISLYQDKVSDILPLMDPNGIKMDEYKRSFDIVDCYTYFGDDIEYIMEVLRKGIDISGSKEEQRLMRNRVGRLKSFLSQNIINSYNGGASLTFNVTDDLKEHLMEKVLTEKYEVDFTEHDKDGFSVSGSGHVVTKDEKVMIFKAMEEYQVPFTTRTFELMLKRLHNGQLYIIDENTLTNYLENHKTK